MNNGILFMILAVIALGMAAGFVASLIVARNERRNWTLLFVVGVGGSFLGGLVFSLIAGEGFRLRPSGVIGSVVGATALLAIVEPIRRSRRRRERAREKAVQHDHHQPHRKHPHHGSKH